MSVILKKATVDAFLAAAKELGEFLNRHSDESVSKDKTFIYQYNYLCQKDEDRALDLCAESENKISNFTFSSLAGVCFNVLGSDFEETFYKMLQLLGIEVTE